MATSYNLGTAEGRIVVDGSGASKGFKVAEAAAAGFSNAVKTKVAEVEQVGKNLVKIGTAGVAGFGVAVNAAMGFEQRLSAIKAVSGNTEKQMEAIRAKALQLGKDTAFSASEAAMAMEELVKAGLSTEDVLGGAADATVALAAAGEISLPQAAEIASAAMNQFNLTAGELPGVADAIAGAANASAISVGEFNQSLQQVGAVANLAGLSFEDTAVAIAELGNAGIKGSDAGTSIKTFLTGLIPLTDAQKDKFQELGLVSFEASGAMEKLAKEGIKPVSSSYEDVTAAVGKYIEKQGKGEVGTQKNVKATQELLSQMGIMKNQFFDAEGNLKSMAEIQELLQNSTKDLTKEQKLATLEMMFGSDAIRAAAVFADNGAEGFNKLADSMGKVTAQEVAETRMDNLAGSVEEMKGSFETAMITIGTVVLPFVRKLVDGVTSAINVFNNLPAPVQTAIGAIFGIGSVLSIVAGGLTLLLVALPAVLGKLLLFRSISAVTKGLFGFFKVLRSGAGVASAFRAFSGPIVTLGRNVTMLARVGMLLGKAMLFIKASMGWVGLIVAAIGFLIWAYNNLELFRNAVDAVVDVLQAGLEWVLGKINAVLKAFGAELGTAGSSISQFMGWIGKQKALLNTLAFVISGVLVMALTRLAITSTISMAKIAASWLFGGGSAARGAAMMDLAHIKAAAGWVRQTAAAVTHSAAVAARWVWMAATTAASATAMAARWLLVAGAAAAKAVAQTVAAAAKIVARWVFMAAGAMARAAIMAAAWFVAMGPIGWAIAAFIALVAVIIANWDKIKAAFAAAGKWIASMMTALWKKMVSIWNSIIGWLRRVPGWVRGVFSSAASWLVSAGRAVFNGLWNGAKAIWNTVIGWIRSLGTGIKNIFSSAGSWLVSAGRNIVIGIWNGIAAAAKWLYDKVTNFVGSLVDTAMSALGIKSPSRVFAYMGEMMAQGVGEGISNTEAVAVKQAVRLASAITEGFAKNIPNLSAMVDGAATLDATATVNNRSTSELVGASARTAAALAPRPVTPVAPVVVEKRTEVNLNTYNPRAEKASDTEARRIRAVSALGAFGKDNDE